MINVGQRPATSGSRKRQQARDEAERGTGDVRHEGRRAEQLPVHLPPQRRRAVRLSGKGIGREGGCVGGRTRKCVGKAATRSRLSLSAAAPTSWHFHKAAATEAGKGRSAGWRFRPAWGGLESEMVRPTLYPLNKMKLAARGFPARVKVRRGAPIPRG